MKDVVISHPCGCRLTIRKRRWLRGLLETRLTHKVTCREHSTR